MTQFGVEMNLIWIIQVSKFISKLKIIFLNCLSLLFSNWTGDTILRKTRGQFVYFPKTHIHPARMAGLFLLKTGALMQNTPAEGVQRDSGRPIVSQGPRSDLTKIKTVCTRSRKIKNRWSGFKHLGTNLHSTFAIQQTTSIGTNG